MPGLLILASTPIGNLSDAPPRLGQALAEADHIYAEDTRRVSILLAHFGLKRPTRSFFVGNESERVEEISGLLSGGANVVVLTDAGTPTISDPGLLAVRAALAVGAETSIIPGPSAVTAAIAVSGLPGDRFVFEGFLPRKGKARAERLAHVATEERTVVLFVAPERLATDLAELADVCGGDRLVAICREMTKLHEEIWRGSIDQASSVWSQRTVKGEVTVVLAGAVPVPPDLAGAADEVRRLVLAGTTKSEAVRQVATRTGVSRQVLYRLITKSTD